MANNMWYFQANGKKNGPYSDKDLKKLADKMIVTPTTLVWKNDMEKWKPASRISDLFNSEVFESVEDEADESDEKVSPGKINNDQNNGKKKKLEIAFEGLFSNSYLLSKVNRSVLDYIVISSCIFVIIVGICMPWYSHGASGSFGFGEDRAYDSIGAFKTSSGVYFSALFLLSIPIQFFPWKLSNLVSLGLNGLMALILIVGLVSVLQGTGGRSFYLGGGKITEEYGILFGWIICLLGLIGYSVLPYLVFFVYRKNK